MRTIKTTFILSSVALLALSGSSVTPSFATSSNKIDICHGTDSVTNPYNKINVDKDAADGDTGNDHGQGDHSLHTGPIATSQAIAQTLKNAHTAWGDIIPAHDNYGGLNWTTDGQAIYNNDCAYVTVTPTATPTNTPIPTATPTLTQALTPTVTPCDTETPTPTAEVTPTIEPTATPTVTPTEEITPTQAPQLGGGVSDGKSDGLSDGRSDGLSDGKGSGTPTTTELNDPYKGVLGATTMASTGSFTENLMNLLGVTGAFLLGLGFLSRKKILA